ncbi:hypothetical protein EPUS_08959 [Endocarpon pusillum Z07020]|uniref:CHL4 family chromosome segregation protein n=1 Tax=Endocarpon pusillum (strain Z07020 / HMAS-L-300199) TaxID=1263415 RepID=U1GBH8_ENDPU|nr:uncharacterized protein EPUS_08959 [Endocarpon pusillum Z07020]ERF74907.1 hypothetical protein EPUS_08959 [Endocarpon pusillum Z07020]
MVPRNSVRAPTNASVPSALRVPSTTKALVRSLLRLSKPSLIVLALQWLQEENQATCAPYLTSNRNLEEEVDEDYLWSPAETIEELRLTYNRMRLETTINKRHIIDRMLDGDWRRGLSLFQVATIDLQCLNENDKAFRWTALKLIPQSDEEAHEEQPMKKKRRIDSAPYPTVSPSTFLQNLQHEISPMVKAHYYLHQIHTLQNLSVIRICVVDSPYAQAQSSVHAPVLFTNPNRIIFIALPDSCPYIYISVSGGVKESNAGRKKTLSDRMDITSLKRAILEEIPKALSRSHNRYSLESTSLTARSLSTMLALRGNSGTNAANGVYSIFAKGVVDDSPIDAQNTSFAQKILEACEGREDKDCDAHFSEPSLQHSDQSKKRTALAERSVNASRARVPKSEEAKTNPKIAATTRFGIADTPEPEPDSDKSDTAAATLCLDRLQIRLNEDIFPSGCHPPSSSLANISQDDIDPFDRTSPPDQTFGHAPRQPSARLTLTFQGSDVFLGIRKLVELGDIAVEKLPTWMTGEEAVSGGTVRHGLLVDGKGSSA